MAGHFAAKVTDEYPGGPTGIDTSVPNVARICDYYTGGRENFQADRAAAQHLSRLVPGAETVARDNRDFLHRAVRFLAGRGIDQFLDIGAGLPGMPGTPSVLDTARQVMPGALVAYVDYDPVVVSHGSALLAKPDGAIMVRGDVRRPGALLGHRALREHLDFGRPVGLLLMSVLNFVSDDEDPARILATFRDALAPGSYLAIGHLTAEHLPREVADSAIALFDKASSSIWPRTAETVRRLFDGFELVEPGLVPQQAWRPDGGEAPDRETTYGLGAVARRI